MYDIYILIYNDKYLLISGSLFIENFDACFLQVFENIKLNEGGNPK